MNWIEAALSRGAHRGTWKGRPAILKDEGDNTRVIYLDGHLPKYTWSKTGQQQPLWIHPAALDTPGETLYIANGDKSTYAHIGIGLENTIGRYGEAQPRAIQAQVAALLNTHKRHIILIPDCDTAGTKDAWYWKQYGETAGLTVEIRDLRQHPKAAPKSDTRDLIEDDPDLAAARLDCLPPFDFDLYPDELPPEARGNILDLFKPDYQPRESGSLSLYDEWWGKEVLPKVASAAPHGNIHKKQRCPSGRHEDKHGSFRILPNTLVPICVCGTIHKADVADWFKALPYADYRAQQLRQHDRPAPDVDLSKAPDNSTKSELVSPNGGQSEAGQPVVCVPMAHNGIIYDALPEAIRAAGVKVKHTAFMRLLDILFCAGYQPGQTVTIPQMTAALAPYFSDSGIEKAVKSNFLTFENTKENTLKDYSPQKYENSKRGRKAVKYLLPTIPDLAKAYGVSGDFLPPLPLPPIALESNRAYAAHTMRDRLPSGVIVKSVRKLAEELELSPSCVATYRNLLVEQVPGFQVIPTDPHKEEVTPDDVKAKLIALYDEQHKPVDRKRRRDAVQEDKLAEEAPPRPRFTGWMEMFYRDPETGVRKPFEYIRKKLDKDGNPKPPTNKIPLVYAAYMRFVQDAELFFIAIKQPNTMINPARKERTRAIVQFNQFNNPLSAPMSSMAAAD